MTCENADLQIKTCGCEFFFRNFWKKRGFGGYECTGQKFRKDTIGLSVGVKISKSCKSEEIKHLS